MKKKITYLAIVAVIFILAINSCKKESKYDWTKIEPGKQLITGPDSVKGNDSTTYELLAIPRGGSRYTWTILRGPVTLTVDTLNRDPLHYHPYRALIKASSPIDTSAQIVVQETTWAGKAGEADTFELRKISCYEPLNLANFIGEYTCNETILASNTSEQISPFDVNISSVGGDTLINDNFYGTNISLKFILSHDKNETIKVISKLTDEIQTDYFDGTSHIRGEGSYSMCDRTFTIKFAIVDASVGDTILTGTDRFVHK